MPAEFNILSFLIVGFSVIEKTYNFVSFKKRLRQIISFMDAKKLYDSLAENYDKRYENSRMSETARALKETIERNNYTNVIEVGCGSGRWLREIKNANRKIYGLDISIEMLKKVARSNGNEFVLINASADNLPLKENYFDLIFIVNAVHHFKNPERFIETAYSSLKSGGALLILLPDIQNPDYRWYVYDYFPGAKEKDYGRIPAIERLCPQFKNSGFDEVEIIESDKIHNEYKGGSVFGDYFLSKNGTSTLAELTDEEYRKGINAITDEVSKNPGAVFSTNVIFKFVSGKKR